MPSRPVTVMQLRRPFAFTSPVAGEVFAALLLVVDRDVTGEEQAAVAASLVAQGCRYAVCAGLNSSSWDDALDEAAVMADIDGTPSWGFMMTTWHENEPLEDVAAFFLEQALIDDAEPIHRLAILVGNDEKYLPELQQVLADS
jgi:hypothetical protein